MRNLLLLLIVMKAMASGAVNVPTQRGDNQRTAVNANEQQLTQQSVLTRFGKLWTLFSDSKIMAQPLYVGNMISGKCPTGCNTVIFGSMKGTVYAYKADVKPTTVNDTLVWAKYLGDPRDGGDDIDMWATDDPWWGILGTPAIDLANRLIYVAVWNKDKNYRLYALDLQNGAPKKGPVVVAGAFSGNTFSPQTRKQRSALLLDHGSLYVAFGGDNAGMAGWLFVYDAASLTLKAVWSPVSGGPNGGIWMSGGGALASQDGSIFLQTANGPFDNQKNRWGNSLLKLSFNGTQIQVADFFAPCNTEFMNNNDMDLGSASPVFLPGNLILGGGKFGAFYLMDRSNLGKFQPGAPLHPPVQPGCNETNLVLQRVNATSGHIHGAPVFWEGPNGDWIYVMGEGDNLKAFPFQNHRLKTSPQDVKLSAWRPPKPAVKNCFNNLPDNWMPGGILTVSSNGKTAGSGVVWALVPANGDANSFRGVKGMLMAFNAENVGDELFRSQGADPNMNTANSLGLLSRFCQPAVVDGKVFVPNSGDTEPLVSFCHQNRPHTFPLNYALVVYGLK
jgi:hypothetical protein